MYKNIIFFLDFHENSGLGHLNRCLKLRDILNIKNVTFVTQKKINIINIHCINKNFGDFIKKNKKKYDLAVFDSYNKNYNHQKNFKKFVNKIIVIDDLCENKFYCDYLINYNPYVKEISYRNKVLKRTLLFLGINYNFILKSKNKLVVQNFYKKNVLIYFGKKKRTLLIRKILSRLLNIKNYLNKIIILSNYPIRSDNFSNLKVLQITNKINVNKLIVNSEICIISAGIILYEAFNLNKIIFSKPISKNQKQHFNFLEKNNHILCLDKLKNITKKKLMKYKKIINYNIFFPRNNIIFKLIKNPLQTYNNKSINLEYYNPKYLNDIYLMQTMDYRRYYKNKKSFTISNHQKYFKKIEYNKKINFLIIKVDNNFAGYVKTEDIKKLSIISIAINTKFQNLKIATKILKFLNNNDYFAGLPTAYISKKNTNSIKAFKNANIKNIKFF